MVGVGTDEANVLGPLLQNKMQYDVVALIVADAKARDARIVFGGDPDEDAPGYFFPTTLVAEAGTIWINSHGGVHPMVPFGGAKKSGYGLEFGVEGLTSVAVPQVING